MLLFQRSTLCALGAVAGARSELAEAVVAGGALPPALLHAGHDAAPVRRAAASLIRDIVKHSVDVSERSLQKQLRLEPQIKTSTKTDDRFGLKNNVLNQQTYLRVIICKTELLFLCYIQINMALTNSCKSTFSLTVPT